jgi:hypothetical protein
MHGQESKHHCGQAGRWTGTGREVKETPKE